jgi:hypothetical protein
MVGRCLKHWGVVIGIAMAILTGCAGDVGDIDRTQPGKIKKSAFDGEWYMRQTVIDVPYTTAVTFIGEQSALDRVTWELSEKFLTAYRSYERVSNAEKPSLLAGEDFQGAPVASFSISSHFDVVRVYNEATGEQTNVIVENTTDRPWYERSYIRVDWSTNHLANFEFLAGGTQGLGVRSQSASYVVTDPNHPDAPVFGVKDGEVWTDHRDPQVWGLLEKVDYFDLSLKLQISPDTFELDYGDGTSETWPACWFYDVGPWDCASQTIKLRASFLKVEQSDYIALDYPDNYVPRDADGELVYIRESCSCDVTEDCDSIQNTQCPCDIECTSISNAKVCDTAERALNSGCVQARVGMFDRFGYFRVEREGYDRDYGLTEEGRSYLATRHDIWEGSKDASGATTAYSERTPEPIVYYLSPGFPSELLPAAAEVGSWYDETFSQLAQTLQGKAPTAPMFQILANTYATDGQGEITNFGERNGDLRYNHLYWVDKPQFETLFGYGPSGSDPLSGEIIAADAYVYGGAIDAYAANSADVIELMRGSILESEFIDGENVNQAIAQIQNTTQTDPQAMRDMIQGHMDEGFAQRLEKIRAAGPQTFQRPYDWVGSRLRLADGDPLFDALWNNEMQATYEKRVGRKLEPSQFGGRRLLKAWKKHQRSLSAKGVDFKLFDDPAVLGLVDEFGAKTREDVILALRQYVFKSTAAHEVGHTLGLRHNFAGSADALNYHDAYWEKRGSSAQALELPTRAEMNSGLREHAYSSIMEYGAKFMSDIRGLGKYDKAALKFGYGQLVEVFSQAPSHPLLGYYDLENLDDYIHYTDWPSVFSSATASDGRTAMRTRFDVPLSDVVEWLRGDANSQVDYTNRVVPYKFCSDEYDGALWDCATFDEGADPYEIVNYAAEDYRNYYIFRAFKRHRRYLDPWDYYYSSYSYTMLPMAAQYQHWLYNQWTMDYSWSYLHSWAPYDDDLAAYLDNTNWNLDKHGGLSGSAAAFTALNFLTEVIAMPEPGSYAKESLHTDRLTWWSSGSEALCSGGEDSLVDDCYDAYLPLNGSTRHYLSEFDVDSGYYFYERIRSVGSFWDKLAAIETLADPTTNFLGVDDMANYNQYILGFNVAFPHSVSRIFGALVNEDYVHYAPQLLNDGSYSFPSILETTGAALSDTPSTSVSPTGFYIDPATPWDVSVYALFYGMALLNANYDQSFNDFAKVWIEGSGEGLQLDPGLDAASLAAFTNPYNGRQYKAVKSDDTKHYSLGFEMLSRAKSLSDAIEVDNCLHSGGGSDGFCASRRYELRNLIDNIELIRGYYSVFGYSFF